MALFRLTASGPGAGGDFWRTSLHVQSTRPIDAVDGSWQAFLTSFVGGTLAPLWPNDQELSQRITTEITEADGRNISQKESGQVIPGTDITAGTISQRSALVLGLKDGAPTKAGRGRNYWPPLAGTHLDADGNLQSAVRDSVLAGYKAAIDALPTEDTLMIYHRPVFNRQVTPPVLTKPGTVTRVLTVTAGIIVGTQRRRTNRVQNAYTSLGV
jgi:hypothetical protein